MASGVTPLAPGLARKVKKVLETRTDRPEISEPLRVLSTFYSENTPEARRGLRSTIEKRGLKINKEFLAVSDEAQKALAAAEAQLEALSACCERITVALESSKESTAALVNETAALARKLTRADRRAHLVSAFLDRYSLPPSDAAALRDGPVNAEFFSALERVRSIHGNCRALLRSHHQRAGLELMDVMAAYQESAYERLCRWVQQEARALGEAAAARGAGDGPEDVDPAPLCAALGALRVRPVLHRYAAEEIANARHHALFGRFIGALQRGGPGGVPRPIELHAHDPKRYVGDMLAWLHQAAASEHELITALFAQSSSPPAPHGHSSAGASGLSAAAAAAAADAEPPAGGAAQGADGAAAGPEGELADATGVLDRIFEGVCRPLRLRVEQVLAASPAPSMPLLLALSGLFGFYHDTLAPLLGADGQLPRLLAECRESARRALQETLAGRADRLVRMPPLPPADLAPPPAVAEAVQRSLELLEAANSGLGGDAAEADGALSSLLDPVIAACRIGAAALVPGSAAPGAPAAAAQHPGAAQAYLLNCAAALAAPLAQFRGAAAQVAALRAVEEEAAAALAAAEARRVLGLAGLATPAELVRAYATNPEAGGPAAMANDAALSPEAVGAAAASLFALLTGAQAPMADFRMVASPKIRADVARRAAASIAEAYKEVYDALGSVHGAPRVAQFVKQTPEQIKTVCDGL